MKRLFSIVILFAFTIQLGIPLIWKTTYELNKRAWTISFCQNQEKPEMNCEAKCYLNKKIQESQQEQSSPDEAVVSVRMDFFYFGNLFNGDTNYLEQLDTDFIEVQSHYQFNKSNYVFRPPMT